MSRRAAKVDANQAEIVKALRKVGAFVQPLHATGDGCPDLLIGHAGKTVLMEVKDGAKVPSARALTPDQQIWHREWTGGPLAIVCDVEGALRMLAVCQ